MQPQLKKAACVGSDPQRKRYGKVARMDFVVGLNFRAHAVDDPDCICE